MNYWLFGATYATGRFGFWELLWPLWGEVTLFCRLLVVLRLLQLVTLVFESCCDLYGEKLLFSVGCWLCCDCYDWSHWFSLRLVLNGYYFSFLKSFLLNVRSIWLVVLVPINVAWNALCCSYYLLWYYKLFIWYLWLYWLDISFLVLYVCLTFSFLQFYGL